MKYPLRTCLPLVTLLLTTPSFAEDVFVKQSAAVVRAGKGSAYEEVVTVRKGDKLQVVAREGSWLKVRAGGREGYVFQTAVDTAKPAGDLGADLGRMFSGASGGTAASSANAGRGLKDGAVLYARANGMNTAGLDRMLAFRKSVTGRDWESFTTEGKVGPAK